MELTRCYRYTDLFKDVLHAREDIENRRKNALMYILDININLSPEGSNRLKRKLEILSEMIECIKLQHELPQLKEQIKTNKRKREEICGESLQEQNDVEELLNQIR